MFKEPVDFLKHIADECAYIMSISNKLTKNELLDDEPLSALL